MKEAAPARGGFFRYFGFRKLFVFLIMAHQITLIDQAPAPSGPCSQVIKAGNTAYVSSQIPLSAAGQLVGKGAVSKAGI